MISKSVCVCVCVCVCVLAGHEAKPPPRLKLVLSRDGGSDFL